MLVLVEAQNSWTCSLGSSCCRSLALVLRERAPARAVEESGLKYLVIGSVGIGDALYGSRDLRATGSTPNSRHRSRDERQASCRTPAD